MSGSKLNFTRKRFIQASAIASVMTSSVINFLSNAFGQIIFNNKIAGKLNLTGIFPDPATIGKPGIHLRWIFSLPKGFPDFIEIYRRDTIVNKPSDNSVSSPITIEKQRLNSQEHFSITNNEVIVSLQFHQSLEYLFLEFNSTNIFAATAYDDNNVIANKLTENSGGKTIIEFSIADIKKVSFPKQFLNTLSKIKIIRNGEACKKNKDGEWKKIDTIKYKGLLENINFSNFFKDYHNFFLPQAPANERDETILKYQNNLSNYKLLLQGLSNSQVPVSIPFPFLMTSNVPDNLKAVQQKWIKMVNMLLLSLIDPNIARILGLYFVDDKVETNKKYDYKIIAVYPSVLGNDCAVDYNLGGKYNLLPFVGNQDVNGNINPEFSVIQKEIFDFLFDKNFEKFEQQGSNSLTWRRPDFNSKTNPASYFLIKRPLKKAKILRKVRSIKNEYFYKGQTGELIIPQIQGENNRLYVYTDSPVMIEDNAYNQKYTLAGIDLYGRVSEPVNAQIIINDKSKPVAPVNLAIKERIVNNNARYLLNFSYGPAQFLTSPDAKKFILYKKEHSLNSRQYIKYRLVQNQRFTRNKSGHKIFTIQVEDDFRITDLAGNQITEHQTVIENFKFITFQITENTNKERLPAAERNSFRIIKILTGRTFKIITERETIGTLPDGYGYLHANTGNAATWINTGNHINFIPPTSINLSGIPNPANLPVFNKKYLIAKIAMVNKILIPAYDDAEGFTQMKNATEIYINRAFYESGILNNGTLQKTNGTKFIILAQASVYSSMPGQNTTTATMVFSKLLFEGHIGFAIGETVGIFPFEEDQSTSGTAIANSNKNGFKKVFFYGLNSPIQKEGSILLPAQVSRKYESDPVLYQERIPVSAQLISDISRPSASAPFEALVYISTPITGILTSNTQAYFFPVYSMDITDKINVDILTGRGTAAGYFALTTLDRSDQRNESGISKPVQHTTVLNTIPAQPLPVYKCDTTNSSNEKMYLSIPNKEGRSTICLEWANAGNDLRYELARALDVSIIAALKAKWMSGDPAHPHPPSDLNPKQDLDNTIPAIVNITDVSSAISITQIDINNTTGIYEGLITGAGLNEEDRKKFAGGRINIGNFYFTVTGFINNKILLRLLTPLKDNEQVPTNGSGIISKFPEMDSEVIKEIVNDVTKLQQIANACPEAFSMVTKVPVRENKFTDNVPGQGNGKYFYKVRSVDAAENKSIWSECSDAFYQVDSRAPSIPELIKIESQKDLIFLTWKISDDKTIIGYNIYRTDKKVDDNNYKAEKLIQRLFILPKYGSNLVKNAAIRVSSAQVYLPLNDELSKKVGLNDSPIIVSAVYTVSANNTIDRSINYLIKDSVSIQNSHIINIPPFLLEESTVIVVFKSAIENNEVVIHTYENEGLIVRNRSIVLPSNIFDSSASLLLGIFKAQDYKFGKLMHEQTGQNYLVNVPTVYNQDKKILKNLYEGLSLNQQVVIVLRDGDDEIELKEDITIYEFIEKVSPPQSKSYTYRLEAFKRLSIVNSVDIYSVKTAGLYASIIP